MHKKLNRYFLVLTALVVFCTIAFSYFFLYDNFSQNTSEQLLSIANTLKYNLDEENIDETIAMLAEQDRRLTIIDESGVVLADTIGELEENHNTREEVIAAREDGSGSAVRYSDSEGINVMYSAVLADDGIVIRVSTPMSALSLLGETLVESLIFSAVIGFLIALVCANIFSRKLTKPIHILRDQAYAISRGNFKENIVPVKSGDEIEELGFAIKRMTEKIHAMRSGFVANATHELKTPLTSILGYTETLKSGLIDEPEIRDEILDIIEIQGRRLEHLIGDMLDLSDIESDLTDCSVKTDLIQVIDEVIESVTPMAEQKNIEINLDIPAEVIVIGEHNRLFKIVQNLASNGINYNKENGRLEISIKDFSDKCVMEVKDTGIGIPSEQIDKIFERFYRVNKVRSSNAGGTGLGLSIVKHTLRLYHGTITVESKPEIGTTFYVTLLK